MWSYDGQSFRSEINVFNSKNKYYHPYDPDNFIVLNNQLLFQLEDGHKLWKYDEKQTFLVMTLIGSSHKVKEKMIIYQNALFFRADDGIHGYELWKYDGSDTFLIADIVRGKKGSNPTDLTIFKNQLYFIARDNNDRSRHLWKYDGNQVSKVISDELEKHIRLPKHLVATDDALYFVTDGTDINKEQLWKLIP
ncbi:hypothetical protein [Myxosarcina sp. GI1]|uniref:hypothetical protein n=1 Tax=Myxosarcina sp. GI1 TaxID=1541065 RepID=UPI00056098C1|nr:hypothetical protein [Myxosarcina sp. GI1]